MTLSPSPLGRWIAAGLVAALAWMPTADLLAQGGTCTGLGRAAALRDARQAIFELERVGLDLGDMNAVARAADQLAAVARQNPGELRRFADAFLTGAADDERRTALQRMNQLGLKAAGGDDPLAFWGVVAVIAIAVLVGSGCDGEGGCGGSDCTDPEGPCGGSSGSSSGG